MEGEKKTIFLYTTDEKEWIPAPEYYWKVIHNVDTDEAIAVIGVNDPHTEAAPERLCEDVCAGVSWIDWNLDSQSSGYMYCCDVQEMRKKISFLPGMRAITKWHIQLKVRLFNINYALYITN
jgi:hypothetical protein